MCVLSSNELDDNKTSNTLTCTDAKAVRKVNNDGDKQHLQNDLDKLVKCSETLQILLNFGKYKSLHWNLDVNNNMKDTVLSTFRQNRRRSSNKS